ncbi:hypothetical protein [Pseudoalteromonas tunicata]|uniref:Uncharacterized protein n=1 Tax=Pseudoalteromonas tunicata D2 TaxID=87626 RepID=A4CCS5_9GAMM|nr:hypothetical protein [Pseudoalteromonas tunicata]ATC93872.1 hypothetical protein PTUN_a1209 [Pseudoalteromonas tunicata]AXT29677.1 hypothetical protein D1819_01810 [Pseudoalteromonas tunicata]EAR27368.1 hypothetical protein PTD2_15052 [Pseudoalteromonas tunicata D2]MDP4983703.1 hypothetical protein [Pseudoalteromonas tunicata]
MRVVWFVISAVFIKVSFLGLGLLAIFIATIALGVLSSRLNYLNPEQKNQFSRLFKTGLILHFCVYFGLILKLTFIDGWQDVATFIVGHLVMHHIMSSLIGAIALIMAIRIFNQRHTPSL